MATNRTRTDVDALKIINRSMASGILVGLFTVIAFLPVPAWTQSLDEAVNAQLEAIGDTQCQRLIAGDTSFLDVILKGQLFTICDQSISSPSNPPSSTAPSGNGATPITVPSIVQKRLREKDPQKDKSKKTEGASADSVVELESGINLFFSAEYEALNRDITQFGNGYDSDLSRVTIGADYQFTQYILAGLAVDYAHHEGDFINGGGFEIDTLGGFAFGSFRPFEQFFLQVTAGYARKMYKRDRNTLFILGTTPIQTFNGMAKSDYNANEVRTGVLMGYNHSIGNFTISPRTGIDFLHIDFGTFSESGGAGMGLTIHDDELSSLQTSLGLQASVALSTGWGALVPQVGFDWIHEFKNDQRDVEVSFVDDTRANRFTFQTTNPERDWMELNAGAIMELKNKIQIFVNYRTLIGHSFFDSHAGTIGVRFPL